MSLLLLRGMKRSGNHLIASWIRDLSTSCFVNNLVPAEKVFRRGGELPPPLVFAKWLRNHRRANRCTTTRRHLIGLEDLPVDYEPFRKGLFKAERGIVLVRNPFNMFASRLRKSAQSSLSAYPDQWGPQMMAQVRLWKRYGRAALDILGARRRHQHVVIFDHFVLSRAYRVDVARQLGLVYQEPRLGWIPTYGGGSSFEGNRQRADSSFQEAVVNRRNQLTSEEETILHPIFEDPELHDMWDELDASIRHHRL